MVALGDDPAFLISDRVENVINETVWTTKALDISEPDNIFILLDPLPPEIGAQARILVSGVTLIKSENFILSEFPFTGDFFQYEGPLATDLIRSDTGRIQVIHKFTDDSTIYDYYLVVAGAIGGTGGGDAKLAVTPSGGIAAMTTDTAPYVFPFEYCDLVDEYGDLTGDAEAVYNMVMMAITGNALIQLKKIGSRYFVDVDNCPTSVISS